MDSDNQVAITISDTGCGIPKSFRTALFQPFRQADSSLTRPKQGTGLGLSIVKHLVQRMSGTVDVESVEGVGSTFTVKLPITIPTNSPPRVPLELPTRKRIKVVYRHERTAKIYVDLWNRHGMLATLANRKMSLAELLSDADAVWTDVESIQRSPALKELLRADGSVKLPPLFIVHADANELDTLEPALSSARGVILVKRPVILNALVETMLDPEPHMGVHISAQSRVRFALPRPTPLPTPVEVRKDMFSPALSESDDLPPEGKDKILLVEDNLVRCKVCV